MKIRNKKKFVVCAPTKLLATMSFILEPLIHWSKNYDIGLIASSKINPALDKYDNIDTTYFKDIGLFSLFSVIPITVKLLFVINKLRPSIVVGTNESGIISVAIASLFYKNCTYICLHDEIRTPQDRRGDIFAYIYGCLMISLLKASVKRYSVHCSQDKWRSNIISKLYNIDPVKFINIPNTNAVMARQGGQFYLHNLLSIGSNKKILLWIGRLKPESFLISLINALHLIDEEYVLVIHARDGNFSSEIKKILTSCDNLDRVFLSTKSVPYSDINKIIQSAYIGFSAFEDVNINSRWIGYSSGKLNRFLQLGVPCVVTKQYGLKWVVKNNLGLSAYSQIEIAQAVKSIGVKRSYYSERASEYCKDYIDIELSMNALDRFILECQSSTPTFNV